MSEIQQSLADIFEEFDNLFEKPKKGKKKEKYTQTESAAINKHDIQFAGISRTRDKSLGLENIKINGGLVCYNDSYKDVLRKMIGAETIFADLETGSYDATKDSLDPWKNCWPIGLGISVDEGPAYYIPIDKENEDTLYDLLFELFHHRNCKRWINHNIKYDAHVLYNAGGIDTPDHVQLIDTVTLAKLIDSERFRYGLDHLSKDWLDEDISQYEALLKPYLYRNKDYSVIPLDIIAPYACQDVITNKKLYKYICDNLPEECYFVRDMEIDLTRVLVDIERNGMRISPEDLQLKEINNIKQLIQIEEELEKITGRSFRPHTNADCFDIICNYFGLPVLKWTNSKDEDEEFDKNEITEIEEMEDDEENKKASNPSFDKHALVAYLSHPIVISNEHIKKTIELISEYRKINTFNNLFVKKYRELASGNKLHPSYNQCVRSGRMSCKKPNAQQLNELAKELILPDSDEEVFVSYDFSQIEYRTIAHYIESPILIDKYNNDPDVDFHEFVAQLVREETQLEGMTRKGGKTLNFGLGFNMGKKKLLRSLRGVKDLMDSLVKELKEAGVPEEEFEEVFSKESEKRAELVFNGYHRTFPEMKKTSRQAQAVCEQRGYIRNLFNRRRHLSRPFAYKAFNTINQASAADILKNRMSFIGKLLRETKHIIKMVASVHDEVLFSVPKGLAENTKITHTIAWMLENPVFPNGVKLLVPIRVACGIGNNWKEASKSAKVQKYNQAVSIEEFKGLIK